MEQTDASRRRIGRLIKAVSRLLVPNVGTLILVGLLLWAQQAGALPFSRSQPQGPATNALPEIITYQGKLTDASGNPIDADTAMTFALYTVSSGGTALWSEDYSGGNAVPVQGGEFTVQLGSINPLPADIWETASLYLGIKIGADSEMVPRERIGAVPQAAQASLALQALTVADGSVGSPQLADAFGGSAAPLSNVIIRPWGADIWSGPMGLVVSATLDLRTQTSPTASAIILHVYVADSDQGRVRLYYPGETNGSKMQTVYGQSDGMNSMLVIVPCDANQRIMYHTTNSINNVCIRLLGWIEPAK